LRGLLDLSEEQVDALFVTAAGIEGGDRTQGSSRARFSLPRMTERGITGVARA
jgi:hypothetical protein